jgi:hypothetical protein
MREGHLVFLLRVRKEKKRYLHRGKTDFDHENPFSCFCAV